MGTDTGARRRSGEPGRAAPVVGGARPQIEWLPSEGGGRRVSLTRGAGPLFVLRPEVLVTPTSLSTACSCTRRAALSKQRKESELAGQQLLLGTMKHEVFAWMLLRLRDALAPPAGQPDTSRAQHDAHDAEFVAYTTRTSRRLLPLG